MSDRLTSLNNRVPLISNNHSSIVLKYLSGALHWAPIMAIETSVSRTAGESFSSFLFQWHIQSGTIHMRHGGWITFLCLFKQHLIVFTCVRFIWKIVLQNQIVFTCVRLIWKTVFQNQIVFTCMRSIWEIIFQN